MPTPDTRSPTQDTRGLRGGDLAGPRHNRHPGRREDGWPPGHREAGFSASGSRPETRDPALPGAVAGPGARARVARWLWSSLDDAFANVCSHGVLLANSGCGCACSRLWATRHSSTRGSLPPSPVILNGNVRASSLPSWPPRVAACLCDRVTPRWGGTRFLDRDAIIAEGLCSFKYMC